MTAFKMTVLAALLASVSGDAPLSTSYGAPQSDSYSPHYGGHETVKRHTATGVQDCNCSGGSGGSSYNGGSASVQPTRPNYNAVMASPQPPPSYTHTQPVYSSPPAPQPPQPPAAPVVAPQPPPSYTHTQPVYSSPPAPQPPQPPPAPVVAPQPQQPAHVTYAQPTYSYPTQPTQPTYNAPTSVQPPAPSPVYSGGGRPVYSGGRPDYNAYPPQGYAGWGLSTKPYNFGYSVKDFNQGTDFKQQETSDGNTVKGQYRVQLPDGRLQIVTYTADWQTGFHADVQYEGEASYPAVYGVGGSYPPSSHHSSSYGAPVQSYGTPAQSTYSAPAQSSYSAPPQSSYSAPSHTSYSTTPQASYGAPSGSGWNQGASYQERVGVGGVGSQYLNIGHSTGGSSYGAPTSSSYGAPTSSSYHPTSYGK